MPHIFLEAYSSQDFRDQQPSKINKNSFEHNSLQALIVSLHLLLWESEPTLHSDVIWLRLVGFLNLTYFQHSSRNIQVLMALCFVNIDKKESQCISNLIRVRRWIQYKQLWCTGKSAVCRLCAVGNALENAVSMTRMAVVYCWLSCLQKALVYSQYLERVFKMPHLL